LTADRNPATRLLRSTPITGASSLLRDGPSPCPATDTPACGSSPLASLSPAGHLNQLPALSGRGVLPFRAEAWFRAHAIYMPDAARAVNRNPPDSSRENHQSPVSTSDNALRHVIDGSLSFVFSDHTCRIQCDISMTLTTTAHSPQQLMAVWNLRLHSDSEGPTFISSTALKSKEL